MPRVNGDELGRRIFQIEKGKAVESAMEKMRHTLAGDWALFREGDYEALKEILGEAWTSIERPQWNSFQFSRLSRDDIVKLAALGRDVRSRHTLTEDTRWAFEAILKSASGDTRKH